MAGVGVGLVRIENITAGLNDIGKWLYIGCHVEQVGRWRSLMPNYEVQHTLLYEPDGWNTIYKVANYKAYRTTLFRGPTGLILPYGYGTDLDNGFRT
jgi:hypothetical protein